MGCCTSAENMKAESNPASSQIVNQLENHRDLHETQKAEEKERETSVVKETKTKIVVTEITENEPIENDNNNDNTKQDRMNTMIELPEPSLNEDSNDISSLHTSPTTKIGDNLKFNLDVEERTPSPLPDTPEPNNAAVVVTPQCYTPINDRLDLNVDEHRLKFQIDKEFAETEEKFEREKKKHFRNETFDVQLKKQRSLRFDSLYQVFEKYAIGDNKDKMDINGLSKALAVFGMVIDTDRDLQKFVLKQFTMDEKLDKNGECRKEIDYNDFSSTMSAIIATKDDEMTDESLLLLFQIFDIDQDGYLEVEDIARILLSVNQIAVVATKGKENQNTISYSKRQCLKQSRKLIGNQQLNENKISFEQFKSIMMNKTEKDLMIDHMAQPSISYKMEAPRVSGLM